MSESSSPPSGLTAAQPFPPDCAARFKPIKRLAAGGFGAVYLAHQQGLDRPVAIKLLLEHVLADPEQVKRFVNEARITASLSHPHVVTILDHGAEHQIPWIAYEYLPGPTLRAVLDRGVLRVPDALGAMIQVAGGVGAGHERGILHRDLKPENVMQADGQYKVADFGIAKWSGEGQVRTRTGIVMGTPAYLAPELISGLAASPASDVYALGVMLFELLTGRTPYEDANYLLILERHLRSPIPLPGRFVAVPAGVDALVQRALAKEPDARFADAADLRDALEALVAGTGPAPASAPVSRRSAVPARYGATRAAPSPGSPGRPALVLAGGAPRRWPRARVALFALALALAALRSRREPPQVARSVAAPSIAPAASAPLVDERVTAHMKRLRLHIEAMQLWAPSRGAAALGSRPQDAVAELQRLLQDASDSSAEPPWADILVQGLSVLELADRTASRAGTSRALTPALLALPPALARAPDRELPAERAALILAWGAELRLLSKLSDRQLAVEGANLVHAADVLLPGLPGRADGSLAFAIAELLDRAARAYRGAQFASADQMLVDSAQVLGTGRKLLINAPALVSAVRGSQAKERRISVVIKVIDAAAEAIKPADAPAADRARAVAAAALACRAITPAEVPANVRALVRKDCAAVAGAADPGPDQESLRRLAAGL